MPLPDSSRQFEGRVNKKDAHVVAAALLMNPSLIFLTLDKNLINEVNIANLGVIAMLPGNFIKNILPTHQQYILNE